MLSPVFVGLCDDDNARERRRYSITKHDDTHFLLCGMSGGEVIYVFYITHDRGE